MANLEHVQLLHQGVHPWNSWRETNPNEKLDLTGANFEDAKFTGANLQNVDFTAAILKGSYLNNANLTSANLQSANLQYANLNNAILTSVNLINANLTGANLKGASLKAAKLTRVDLRNVDFSNAILQHVDFKGANLAGALLNNVALTGANLQNANLSAAQLQRADLRVTILTNAQLHGADLTDAKLLRTDCTGAYFHKTRFRSRTSLSGFSSPLTDVQISGCIFADEVSDAASGKSKTIKVGRVRFPGDGPWTPINMGLFLGAFQLAYNRTQYLITTEDEDEYTINNIISGRAEIDADHNIQIGTISRGSTEFEFVTNAFDKETVAMIFGAFSALGVFVHQMISLKLEDRKTRIDEKKEQREQDMHQSRIQKAEWEMRETREKALALRGERFKYVPSLPVPASGESSSTRLTPSIIISNVLTLEDELTKALAPLKVKSMSVERKKVLYLATANAPLIIINDTLSELNHGRIEIICNEPPK